MEILLGIDGGGTKTDLAARTRQSGDVVRARAAGCSLSWTTPTAVEQTLQHGCEQALAPLGARREDCVSVCAGFASAGQHRDAYEAMLRRLLPRARVRVMSDAELALEAATGGGDGIVVISGTGSIAWGRYGGQQARAGGAGPGRDGGSGDWIGREAVGAGLIGAPADGNFAALVPEVAQRGLPAAEALFRRAGEELAALLLACARSLGSSAPAAYYAGGVLTHVPLVRAGLAEAWPHALAALPRSPADAALELAR